MRLTDDMQALMAAHHAGHGAALHGLADMMIEHDDPTHQWHGELLRRALLMGDVQSHRGGDATRPADAYMAHRPDGAALRLVLHGNGHTVWAYAPVSAEEMADHLERKAPGCTDASTRQGYHDLAAMYREGTNRTKLWPGHPERLARTDDMRIEEEGRGDEHAVHYHFLGGGHQFRASYHRLTTTPRQYLLEFDRAGATRQTGDAGAAAVGVFRNVTDTMDHFVATHKPRVISFTATHKEPTRVKLYDALARRFAERHGGQVKTEDMDGDRHYHVHLPRPTRLSRVGATLTGNMRARVEATRRILAEAGVNAAALPVMAHDDAVGVRPDVLVASEGHVHPALLRYLAAHHGLLHGTPNVVAFNAHDDGPDRVHVIHTGVDQATAFDTMRRAGFPKFSVHKGTVYLFDPTGAYDVSPLLRVLNASRYHAIAGTGRVVGAGEGADAGQQRSAYRDAIRSAEDAAASVAARPAGDSQGAAAPALKLSRTPEGTLAYHGDWHLPPESLDALFDHATGVKTLSDNELLHHLTNTPHPAAGAIFIRPVRGVVNVRAMRAGYKPPAPGLHQAIGVMHKKGILSDAQAADARLGLPPWTQVREPGHLSWSVAQRGGDWMLYHAPSDSWIEANVNHYPDVSVQPHVLKKAHDASARLHTVNFIRRFLGGRR